MAERNRVGEYTSVQVDQETFETLKGMALADLRSTPKEIRFLVQAEVARRNDPALAEYLAKFIRAPKGD
jgi:hypothetical protein